MMRGNMARVAWTVAALAAASRYEDAKVFNAIGATSDMKMPPLSGMVPRHTPKLSGRPPVGWRQVQGRARHAERMRRQRMNRR